MFYNGWTTEPWWPVTGDQWPCQRGDTILRSSSAPIGPTVGQILEQFHIHTHTICNGGIAGADGRAFDGFSVDSNDWFKWYIEKGSIKHEHDTQFDVSLQMRVHIRYSWKLWIWEPTLFYMYVRPTTNFIAVFGDSADSFILQLYQWY